MAWDLKGINELEPDPPDVLTRKSEITLRMVLDLEERVRRLESLLKEIGRTISESGKR